MLESKKTTHICLLLLALELISILLTSVSCFRVPQLQLKPSPIQIKQYACFNPMEYVVTCTEGTLVLPEQIDTSLVQSVLAVYTLKTPFHTLQRSVKIDVVP